MDGRAALAALPSGVHGRPQGRHTGRVVISRGWALFLIGVGVWTWVIWPRFGVAIFNDDRSFSGGSPTSFLWVHAVLIAVSLVLGTMVGVLGVRARFSGGRARSPQD
jgi:hypothetical protein